MTLYLRKPEPVWAMFWDGSKESYQKIKEWMPQFLSENSGPSCDYWDENDAPPEQEQLDHPFGDNFEWNYRYIRFYAWGDDQELEPERWVLFRGSEKDLDDTGENVPRGSIMDDAEFKLKYDPAVPEPF